MTLSRTAQQGRDRRLRVGLLVYGLDRPLIGVTRVALELGRALQRSRACEVVFLTTYARGPFRDGREARSIHLAGCARVPGLMVLGGPQIALAARRFSLDIVHDPVGVSPFTLGRWAGSFRRLLTIHDAIAFRFPHAYSWSNSLLHRRFVPATLGNVDGIITGSEDARYDLERLLGLPPDRIWVVPNGVGEQFRPLDDAEASRVVRRHGLTRPYLLYVGTRQARKNVRGLVEAFARLHLRMPSHQLALVGPSPIRDDGLDERIAALGLSDEVRVVGPVPDEDLPALYSAADLFVFPSLVEGFGLPLLEAMASGTPIVSSNASSLGEVAGDAAVLVDARDPVSLSDGMLRVLRDPALHESLRARGLKRASHFTWDRAAEATLGVYRRLMSAEAAPLRRRAR